MLWTDSTPIFEFTLIRWLLLGSVLFYLIPIFLLAILFRRSKIIGEIMFGALSFLFYTPTYLLTLNIYSLCRMDSVSWGTKGIEQTSGKHANLQKKWRQIKFIHVVKYLIWNIILSSVMLSLGDYT